MIALQQLSRPARWVGYPAFGLLVFVGTIYLALPRDRIRDRLKTLVSQSLNMDVRNDDFGLTLLTGPGVEAKNVELRSRPVGPTEKAARYMVDDVVIHFGLIDLIRSRTDVRFSGHAVDGSIEGAVRANADDSEFRVDARDINLGKIPVISQAVTLPVDGVLSVKGDVAVPHNLVAQATGSLDIGCDGCIIGDGVAKVTIPNDPMFSQGMTFPKLKLGRVAGNIVLDKGRATIKELHARSPDVEVDVDGYVEVRDPIVLSLLHLYIRVKPSEALAKREPTIELVNNMLGSLSRRSDGALGFSITGTLAAPLPLPAKEPPPGVTIGRGGAAPVATTPLPTSMAHGPRATPMPPPFASPLGRRGDPLTPVPALPPSVEFAVPEAPTPPPPPAPAPVAPPPPAPVTATPAAVPVAPPVAPGSAPPLPPSVRGGMRPPIEGGGSPGTPTGDDGERERHEREREREREAAEHAAPVAPPPAEPGP